MNNLSFALQMEIDGEQYYLNQAELNKGTSLHEAFLLLAEAEKKHADLLRNINVNSGSINNENLPDGEPTSLFFEKADYKRDAVVVPGQLEVYLVARDMEQKSINLYQGMLTETGDEQTRKLIKFLIVQEQDHFDFFDELIILLRKPRDWVEDAEFGRRKDY